MALRLQAWRPTIFQIDTNSIYYFSETGVQQLPRDKREPSVDFSNTWALIDAKQDKETAPIFLRSNIFLVVASSPRPTHWEDVEHYRPPAKKGFMAPFTLEELIQASVSLFV